MVDVRDPVMMIKNDQPEESLPEGLTFKTGPIDEFKRQEVDVVLKSLPEGLTFGTGPPSPRRGWACLNG